MNLCEQRSFVKAYKEAKKMVKDTGEDHIIVFIPNSITSQRFRICTADKFFSKPRKQDNLMCYLAHP